MNRLYLLNRIEHEHIGQEGKANLITGIFQGISPTLLALALAVMTAGVLCVLLGLGANNPVLLRMGLRNMGRRPGRALVLLCGLALATAVITASLGLSDSFTDSALQHRLARMGNVDESITGPFTQSQIDTAIAKIRRNPDVQGIAAISFSPQGPTVVSTRTGFAVHNTDFYGVPSDFDHVYGPLSDARGQAVHFADLAAGEAFVSPALAQSLAAQPGDILTILFGTKTSNVTVRAILSNDIGVTSGEAVAGPLPEIIVPLALVYQVDPQPLDTICIKNVGPGGLADAGPGGSRSQAVIQFLQRIFPGTPASLNVAHAFGTTEFDSTRIHPMMPDVAERATGLLQMNKLVFLSPIGQQFSWLPPLFTWLLVGAGMLLLVLLVILLTAERRTELGMSRALGLRRSHLVQLLLFEGCGYAISAALLGLLLGCGITALELQTFSLLPELGVGVAANSVPIPVLEVGVPHLSLSWQSLLSAACLGVLVTIGTVLVTAFWISRLNIVIAIRDLDEPARPPAPIGGMWRSLWKGPVDEHGKPIPETPARRVSRGIEAVGGLVWGLWKRGPLCLLVGGLLFLLGSAQAAIWLQQLAVALFIAGGGLLLSWLSALWGLPGALARRLSFSVIGIGWLVLGLLASRTLLALFQPVVLFSVPPSILELLLDMLLLVAGAVLLVMSNADLPGSLVTIMLRRVRGLVPVSRTSLVYPFTYRFRTGVTVTLLSLVVFLVLLLITINLGAVQEAQAVTNVGGFQLEATVFGSQLHTYPDLAAQLRAIQVHRLLGQDFTSVGLLRLMYDFPQAGVPVPLQLDLSGQLSYSMRQPPQVADDAFLSDVTLPLYARARGFASDQQVWKAVRNQPGDIVLQYDSSITGLPGSSDFTPFSANIPDSSAPSAHYHRVTVIGLMPASAPWRVLLSLGTAEGIAHPPYIQFINDYLFQLRQGVSEAHAAQDLNHELQASLRGIAVQSLDQGSLNGVTAVLTLLLSGELDLGLLFGALAIGVITARAVVERRQQIGMLRALGFSRILMLRSFLLEAGFIILLSLLIGASLALGLAAQVARATYQDFPFPVIPVVLILLGSFLAALISTALPAWQAARLRPAEALRYE